jgi:acyl-CoA synthetase (AMP-forming)/AMP-acid ligase II
MATTFDVPVGQDVKSSDSYTALTPLAFLERSLDVFADKTAIAYGDRRLSYSEFGAAATHLANALRASGIERGDRVAYMCPNIPEMLVANFGVPLAGAVMVPINVRLSAEEVRYICDHSGAKLPIADTEYLPALAPVLGSLQTVQQVVALSDPLGPASPAAVEHAHISYDELMARGSGDPLPWTVDDELGLNIVISGGENISTIEIEHAIESHPAVFEVAVIGMPDPKWGERPKAFVVRRPDADVTEEALIAYLQTHIARFKVPKAIEFVEFLPRTSTGKLQKFALRDKEWAGHSSRIQG